MTRDQLYLLKPDFLDHGPRPWSCSAYVEVAGLLEFYPLLKQTVEVHYTSFPRPRPELVPVLGEAHQRCPVLILHHEPQSLPSEVNLQGVHGHAFVEGARDIATYFAHVHETGMPH